MPVAGQTAEGDPTGEVGVMLSLLWRSNHALETLSKRMFRVLGATGPQRMVLRIVARQPGISAGRVSDAARLHASTLTGILDRLVRGGFLVRTRDAEDGRRARFEVTPAGRRVADTQQGTVESAMRASLAEFSPLERAIVKRWLVAFGDALEREHGVMGQESPAGEAAPNTESAEAAPTEPSPIAGL